MVAFSRRCRRLVRRRDKVTLAMHGPPISRRILVEPLTGETAAASNWRRGKTRLAAKKRQRNTKSIYKLIHPSARSCALANACEGAARRLKSPRPNDSRESDDAVRPPRWPPLGSTDIALGRRARLCRGLDR